MEEDVSNFEHEDKEEMREKRTKRRPDYGDEDIENEFEEGEDVEVGINNMVVAYLNHF
jgi:hypothetical protein